MHDLRTGTNINGWLSARSQLNVSVTNKHASLGVDSCCSRNNSGSTQRNTAYPCM